MIFDIDDSMNSHYSREKSIIRLNAYIRHWYFAVEKLNDDYLLSREEQWTEFFLISTT